MRSGPKPHDATGSTPLPSERPGRPHGAFTSPDSTVSVFLRVVRIRRFRATTREASVYSGSDAWSGDSPIFFDHSLVFSFSFAPSVRRPVDTSAVLFCTVLSFVWAFQQIVIKAALPDVNVLLQVTPLACGRPRSLCDQSLVVQGTMDRRERPRDFESRRRSSRRSDFRSRCPKSDLVCGNGRGSATPSSEAPSPFSTRSSRAAPPPTASGGPATSSISRRDELGPLHRRPSNHALFGPLRRRCSSGSSRRPRSSIFRPPIFSGTRNLSEAAIVLAVVHYDM